MNKPKRGWILTGTILILVPMLIYRYLIFINIDCDQFACIGYAMVLLPMFFTGIFILLIVLLVNIIIATGKQIKKKKNETAL